MQSQANESTEEQELALAVRRDKRSLGVGISLFLALLAVVVSVGWGYHQIIGESANQQASEPANQIVSTPVESAKPGLEVKPIFVVWNASGVAGAAGRLAEKLKAEGFEVSEIKNAPKEQAGTSIVFKTMTLQKNGVPTLLAKLYPEAKESVDSELEVDILIVIGK